MPRAESADTSTMRVFLCAVIAVAFFPFFVGAQSATPGSEADLPAWVVAERAEQAFESGDLGRALQLYGAALADQPLFVEARVGMARVYRALGDFPLAERMYLEALDNARQFDVPDERYTVMLELAQMYALQGDPHAAERQLRTIITDDLVFNTVGPAGQRTQMKRVLLEDGVNRVIVLYRVDFPQALEAHRRIARMLLDSRSQTDRDEALDHALFVVVEIVGRGVRALIDRNPAYQFRSLDQFLDDASEIDAIRQYLEAVDFTEALRLLRRALLANSVQSGADHVNDLPL